MKTRYDGSCKVCGALWKEGDEVFYQKGENGKKATVCSDEKCYTEQGGKPFTPKADSGFQTLETGQSTLTNVERKLSTAGALDDSLFTIAFNRLNVIEGKLGDIAVGEKLIFLESWARTLAMSMK